MRKDLYNSNPKSNLPTVSKTAFRINIGIGLTMGIIAFGGMLGPSWPLRADASPYQRKNLTVTQKPDALTEIGVSSNEMISLRDKCKQQDAQIAKLNTQIATLNARIQDLNRTLFAKDNALDNSKLKSLHQKLQAKGRLNASLETKIAALETELAESKHKSSLTEVTIGSLSEMIAILKENKDKSYAQHLDELHQMDVLAQIERQKLQEKLEAYQSKEREWNQTIAQKHEEVRKKEDALNQLSQNESSKRTELQDQVNKLNAQIDNLTTLLSQEQMHRSLLLEERETWNSYAQDLEKDKVTLEESHAAVSALLAQEQLKKGALTGEANALSKYTDNLKQELARWEEKHNNLQDNLMAAGHNAAQKDDEHSILHVVQAYRHENHLQDHKGEYANLRDQHQNLQLALDAAIAQRQLDQQNHESLQRTIADLKNDLSKAYDTISSLHNVKEKPKADNSNNLMAVAQKGLDLQDERDAGRLFSALREENLRNQYDNTHQNELAAWMQDWEQKVAAIETQRDDALTKLQTFERAQKDLIAQIGEINGHYMALENTLDEERFTNQAELTTLQEQLALTREEVASIKLQLDLEKMATILAKKNFERDYSEAQIYQGQNLTALESVEQERDQAQQSLKDAEQHREQLLSELEGLTQKYAQLEIELKKRVTDSGVSEEIFLNQIHELETLTQQLHNDLSDEKEKFALQKESVETHQNDLAQLFQEAQSKKESLENDLQEVHAKHHNEMNALMQNFMTEREQSLSNLATAEEKQNELLKQVDELSQKYQQMQDLETTLASMKSEMMQERETLSKQREIIEKHQAEILELSHMIQDLETQRTDAMNKLGDKTAQQALLIEQLEDLANKYANVEEQMHNHTSSADQAAKEFHDQLQKLESTVKHLETELENERRIGKLQFENFSEAIAAVEDERDSAMKKHDATTQDKQALLTDLDQLRNKVITMENTLTDETARAQNVIQALENQLEITRANLDEMHSTLMDSQDQYSSKESKFLEQQTSYDQKIKALEKELDDMQKFINEQQTEWKTLQKEIVTDLQQGQA